MQGDPRHVQLKRAGDGWGNGDVEAHDAQSSASEAVWMRECRAIRVCPIDGVRVARRFVFAQTLLEEHTREIGEKLALMQE